VECHALGGGQQEVEGGGKEEGEPRGVIQWQRMLDWTELEVYINLRMLTHVETYADVCGRMLRARGLRNHLVSLAYEVK
jgi:hypothetical protein